MSESSQTSADRLVQYGAWGLAGLVSLLAILSWGQDYGWKLTPFSPYVFFPVLGTLAFSLMWSHYVTGTIREFAGVPTERLASYFRVTGYAVLVLICLHPGLLIYQRFRDGYGLPPSSYLSYVAPGLGWVAMLGAVSLLIFLAFELHRFFGNRSWWKYVVDASDFAMLAIFYHGLRLGQLHGWFQIIWWLYGIVLIGVLARKYWLRFSQTKKPA